MNHRRVLALAVLLLVARAASALPTFSVLLDSIADSNGNGLVDCGEEFVLKVLVSDSAPVVSPISPVGGTITIPTTTFQVGWQYSPGTVALAPDNDSCTISLVSGNAPGADHAVFTYSCIPSPTPGPSGFSYLLSARLRGVYVGTTGSAFVTAEDQLDSGELLTANLTVSNVQGCPQADLSLTKSDQGVSVQPGQTINYVLTYSNSGDAAQSVVLRETVPAQTVANLTVSSPGWSCTPNLSAGSMCSLPIGSVPSGAANMRSFAVDVLPMASAPGSVSNTASIATSTPETNLANNTASDSTPVIPGNPDLVIEKTVSGGSATPGAVVVFTMTVNNVGDGLTRNNRLLDSLPPGTTYEPSLSSAGWSCSGSDCQLNLGTLFASESRTATFAVRLPSPVPAALNRISNTACVSTPTAEPTGNNCDSVSIDVSASPNLSIDKRVASGQAVAGATLVFGLTVTNNGDRDTLPVSIVETVPEHTTAAPSVTWSCSPDRSAGSTCTASTPPIPGAGGAADLSFAVVVDNPLPLGADIIRNRACASSPNATEDCHEIEIPTDARSMVMISKELTAGTPTPGSVLVYTLTLQNTGSRASGPVTLSEIIPSNTTFEAASSSLGWTCPSTIASSTCSLQIPGLNGGGATATRLFAVRVIHPLPANSSDITNTACAQEPTSPTPHCDDVTVTPQGNPQLALLKVLSSGSPVPGGLLTYTISVTNSGDQDAAQVVITDTLPSLTEYVSAGSSSWSCSSSQCSHTLPTLAAGAVANLQIVLRLASSFPADVSSITNLACASDGPTRNSCDSVETPLSGEAALSLVKTYTGPPLRPNIDLPFTLLVQNTGTRDAVDVVIRETIPPASNFQPTGSDGRWICQSPAPGSPCELTLDVPAGASESISFVLRSVSTLPPGLRQIANAACLLTPAGAEACDDTTTPLPAAVELTLVDSIADDSNGNGTLEDNELLHYTLVVSNPAREPATQLEVHTSLDPHLSLVVGSVTTSAGSILAGNATGDSAPSVSIPSLAPGASVTIEFDALAVDVLAAHVLEVVTQATANGPQIETEPSDDPDTTDDDDPTRTPVGSPGAPSGVHDIPTLGHFGAGALVLLLGGAGAQFLRRRRRAALP